MVFKKAYIPKKQKQQIDKLYKNKCYFCKKDLSSPEKYDKQYHHFWKESKGGYNNDMNLILSCKDCHKKIHSKVKIEYLLLRYHLYDILCRSFGIVPCSINSYLYDDDMTFDENPFDENNNFHKVKLILECFDGAIGNMNNDYKKIQDLAVDSRIEWEDIITKGKTPSPKISKTQKKILEILKKGESRYAEYQKNFFKEFL